MPRTCQRSLGWEDPGQAGPVTAVSQLESQSLAVPAGLDTPALVVDLDILDQNLAEMASLCRAAGAELWPHAKTHRTVEYARRQLAAGAAGLTVARPEEAEAFAAGGARRMLVAYPLVGESKLARARLVGTAGRADPGDGQPGGGTGDGRALRRLRHRHRCSPDREHRHESRWRHARRRPRRSPTRLPSSTASR